MSTVGLVGLGLMGSVTSRFLMGTAVEVRGFDVDPQRRKEHEERGGSSVGSPAEVAEGLDVVFLSLPHGGIVRDVCFGDDGIARAASNGLVIADTSTTRPEDAVAIAERLSEKGIFYLDATLSGSSDMYARGDAIAMVGGDAEAYERIATLLDAMVRSRYHVGPVGSGVSTKLVVNLIMNINRLVLAEGLVLGEKIGMDLHVLLDILRDSAASSKAMDAWGKRMIEADHFPPGSRIRMQHKTVRLILEEGRRLGTPMWLTAVLDEVLQVAESTGLADADSAATIEVLRRIAGMGRLPMTAADGATGLE